MKHVRKPIALLLALVLAASLLCLPALAADTVPARYARYRVYTCLGDSNAAGYAAEGYQDQPCTVTPGAYHSMVAGDLGAKLNARGWGGFRSHEMRHLLDPDWEINDWEYADNCAGYVQYNDLESRRDIYIQAVEEADLITVNIGSNDILGNPLGQAMREMYNTDGADKAILDAIKAELQKTGDFGTALLKLIGYAESIGQGTKLLVSLAHYMNIAYQQFTENWDAIVKNIYRLNPDVTLVAVGMHNAFANTSLTVGSVIKTGKLLQPIMDKMNAWMKTGSAYAGQYIYCDVPDVECGELAFTQDDFWTAYLPAVHPTAAGHRYIADRILSVLPDTALSFEDVPEGAWYYMDVAACYYRGLMVGVTDTRFAPDMPIIAPWREWEIKSRDEEIDYAEAHHVPLKISRETNYSKDKNLWHLSHEGLDLEDPANEPDLDKALFLEMGVSPYQAPDTPTTVSVSFEAGVPVAVDGEKMKVSDIIRKLNKLGGENGVGILDIVENLSLIHI